MFGSIYFGQTYFGGNGGVVLVTGTIIPPVTEITAMQIVDNLRMIQDDIDTITTID